MLYFNNLCILQIEDNRNQPAWRTHVPLPKYGSHWSTRYKHWIGTVHCHCRYRYYVGMLDSAGWATFLQEFPLFHSFGPPGKYK